MEVLVFLHWPEKCFRANEDDLRYLRSLLPKGTKVVAVKSEGAFLKALPTATHVITWHFRSEWYLRAPQLKLVATPAAGREFIDLPISQSSQPAPLVHFGGFHGRIISETVLAFILAYVHGFFAKTPLWPRRLRAEHCRDLAGTRAVIAGYGRIGRAIEERLSDFGVSVRGLTHLECDRLKGKSVRGSSRVALHATLASADWFILALPSDTGTDDFLDAKVLARLPRRCVVINVGRGNSVDEPALLSALRQHRIAAAYLDVFKHEPTVLNSKSRRISGVQRCDDLARLAADTAPGNLIRMPHSSAFSPSYLRAAFKELRDEKLI